MKQLVALLVLVATFGPQDQRPAVRTSTAGVLIDVTVLDKDGRPVTDLTGADFDVSEDGKPQQVISATLMRGGVPTRISGTTANETAPAGAAAPSAQPAAAAAANRPTPTVTAILFDNLSADSRPFATRAAAQFISTLSGTDEYSGVFQARLKLSTVMPFFFSASGARLFSISA